MKDKSVSLWKKALIIAGIAYVVMPIDLIPIAILPFAWLDDLLLWILHHITDGGSLPDKQHLLQRGAVSQGDQSIRGDAAAAVARFDGKGLTCTITEAYPVFCIVQLVCRWRTNLLQIICLMLP